MRSKAEAVSQQRRVGRSQRFKSRRRRPLGSAQSSSASADSSSSEETGSSPNACPWRVARTCQWTISLSPAVQQSYEGRGRGDLPRPHGLQRKKPNPLQTKKQSSFCDPSTLSFVRWHYGIPRGGRLRVWHVWHAPMLVRWCSVTLDGIKLCRARTSRMGQCMQCMRRAISNSATISQMHTQKTDPRRA